MTIRHLTPAQVESRKRNKAKIAAGMRGVTKTNYGVKQTRDRPGYTYAGSPTLNKYFGSGGPGYKGSVSTPSPVSPPTSKPISNPSTVYAAMGLNVKADTSSHKWDTKPTRTYDGNQIYVHPVNRVHYILGSDGQIAQYDWRHKKLAEVGKEDTNKYPSWFDAKTIAFIKNMGGLSSDPYYNRR